MDISLQTLVSEAGKAKPSIKRLVELADACIDRFGGADGIANKLMVTHELGNPATQAKVMDLVVKLVAMSLRAKGDDDDVSQMTDEQLERELAGG